MRAFLIILISSAACCAFAQTNTFPSTGNAGIGTTSPIENLTISSSASGTNLSSSFRTLNPTSSASIRSIWTQDATSGALSLVVDQGQNGSARAFNLSVGAATNAFYVNGSGNVGIGTTAPTYLLSVGGNSTSMNGGQQSVLYSPTSTSGLYGGSVSQVIANPAASSSGVYYAIYGESGDNAGVTSNLTSASALISVGGGIVHRGTGTITGSVGFYAAPPAVPNGGTITTAYGLFVAGLKNTGVTNSYGIYQSSATDKNYFAGNVGIGTVDNASWQLATSTYKLAINGSAIATQMVVKLQTNWPDYVFKKDYRLPALQEIKTYIDQNHHLPEVPSEQQIAKDGLNLGEMNKLLVKKVEELTLYLIEKDEKEKEQSAQLKSQQDQINMLSRQIGEITKLLNKK